MTNYPSHSFLKKILCGALLLLIASCQSGGKHTEEGAIGGAVVGGVVGATQGGLKGAAIGAALGGAAGGGIGYYIDQQQKDLSKVVKTERTEDGLMVTLKNDLLFDTGKADLKGPAKQTLSELATILKKYPADKLRITGYTDRVGSDKVNMALSEKRAETVLQELESNGVPGTRMRSEGLGESRDKGKDNVPNASYRKVEIYIDVPQTKT